MANRPLRSTLVQLRSHYASLAYFRDPVFALLGVTAFLDAMSTTIMVPLLPTYASRLGASPILVGTLFAAPAATRALLNTPFGHLSDRTNRRLWIATGMTLGGLSVVALGVADGVLFLLVLRAIDGFSAAMRTPASNAYVGDIVEQDSRASAFSAYGTASMLGVAVGPFVGGVLASVGGLALPFLVLGTGTVLGGALLFAFLPRVRSEPDEPADASGWSMSGDMVGLLASLPILAFLLHSFVAAIGVGAFHPFLSTLFARTLEVGPSYTGLVYSMFGVALVLSMPLGGTIADRVGRKNTLVTGTLLWGGVAFGLSQTDTAVLPFALVFLAGVGSGLLGPAWNALVYEIAPEGREATLSGVDGSVHSAGNALGPVIGGGVLGYTTAPLLYFGLGVLWVLNTSVLILLVPEPE